MNWRNIGVAAAGLAGMLLAANPILAEKSAGPAPTTLPLAPKPNVPASATSIGTGTHLLDEADLSAWLDGVLPYALKSGDIAGAVVVVVKDGKVLFQKGYGYSDVAAKKPMDPNLTLIRPGSTSKLFTWTAVMQLVQQGKINLDRNINDYLDFKIPEKFGKPITMRDLMNHRAGFEEGLKDVLTYDPAQGSTTEQYLKTHLRPMLFAPGEVPAYSNYGASLAGYIVERVSGEKYEQYVERHILRPLRMDHSTFVQPLPQRFQPLLAKGYRTSADEPSPYEQVVTRPAGSLSAPAADMARFMLAHLQQGSLDGAMILNPATTALMHRPTETAPPGFGVMAHGFFSGERNGRLVIGHGGDTIVFHSDLNLLPQEGVGIFVNFTSRGTNDAVYTAREELFGGFMDRYFPAAASAAKPTLATAVRDAQQIAGRYQSSRRIENGFLAFLYLLQQSVITINPDGTINAPDDHTGRDAIFREIGPQVWLKVGGENRVALREIAGVKTILTSDNPISVLQEAPALHSAPLVLTILGASLLILMLTLLSWGATPILGFTNRAQWSLTPGARKPRLYQRLAALTVIIYVVAWAILIQPVLVTNLAVYNSGIDWIVRLLQFSGILVAVAAVVGAWAAWRIIRVRAPMLARIWSVLVALALFGILFISVIGKLTSWDINY
jgi:CubicO group peptidase (beta-lactamase class C family)